MSGKSSKQTTEVEIPEFLKQASEKAINYADAAGKIGYVPYQGPTVAALAPQQLQAMSMNNSAASAFGLGGSSIGQGAGFQAQATPTPTTYAGGVQGYSPFDMFMEAWNKVPETQKKAVEEFTGKPKKDETKTDLEGQTFGGGSGKIQYKVMSPAEFAKLKYGY